MQSKSDGFIWGSILIVAGVFFMAHSLGYEVDLTPAFWMGACGVLSAIWFFRYFAGDLKRWGQLLPACQFAAIAIIIGLSRAGVNGSLLATPLFIGFAIPFAVALIADSRKNTWAVIPLTIFSVLALGTLLDERTDNAVPGALAAFVIATPFFFVCFTQPKQWWAFIPAGILSSIGLTALLVALFPALDHSNLKGAIVSLGFVATFGLLHLRHDAIPTKWAKVPAIVFIFIAALSLIDKTGIDGGPLVLIALGVILLFSSLRPQRRRQCSSRSRWMPTTAEQVLTTNPLKTA